MIFSLVFELRQETILLETLMHALHRLEIPTIYLYTVIIAQSVAGRPQSVDVLGQRSSAVIGRVISWAHTQPTGKGECSLPSEITLHKYITSLLKCCMVLGIAAIGYRMHRNLFWFEL